MKQVRKRMAPYVPVRTLSAFLDRIRHINLPAPITSGSLEKIGMSKGTYLALVSALRFLDLIDENGAPTDKLRSLQTSGEEFQTNLEKVVRSAYVDLFSWLDPSKDDREHIRNYFAREFSPATAEKATALFLDLCDEASISTITGNARRVTADTNKRALARERRQARTTKPTGAESDENGTPRFEVRIDSKDFAAMQRDQITAFFEGLSKVVKQGREGKKTETE